MTTFESSGSPWLVELATAQRDTGATAGEPVYDDIEQITYITDPERRPAIATSDPPQTKKADRETGEDQKGF